VDLGTRRIGVAISDSAGAVAIPRCTIERSGDEAADHRALVALVIEAEADTVVVGMPVALSGRNGPAALAAAREAAALAAALTPSGITVETFDERFTTVIATRALRDAGRGGRSRRRVIDQAAAAVFLQEWLDARRRADG
jgi:putative holliday junction resolvase